MSEKAYILFFSRTKQRPRTKFDVVVNGSKSHESNGNKTSIIQQTGCRDTRQVLNHLQESNKSTNGTSSPFQKSSPGKQVNMKISANHSETNRSTNYLAPNGTKTLAFQRSDHVETPADTKVFSDNRSEACSSISSLGSNCSNSSNVPILGTCLEPVGIKVSSNHHSQTINSMKSKIDQGLTNQNRTLGDFGITSKPLAPGNIKISVYKKEAREENGHTTASLTAVEKDKLGVLISEGYGMSKKLADNQITKRGLPLSNGENGLIAMDSLEMDSPAVNGSRLMTVLQKSHDCHDLQNGDIRASNNSCVKRKIKDDISCIFLARDDQSRAEVEAFKELYVITRKFEVESFSSTESLVILP